MRSTQHPSNSRDAIVHRHAQELANHDAQARRNAQADAEWRAWRSPFIVRASLMFNVPCAEVTQAQFLAAQGQTALDTMPQRLR